jgi:hypothetical protein
MAKSTNNSQFPHFSRIISELGSVFAVKGPLRRKLQPFMMAFLMGGVALFIVLNIMYQAALPPSFVSLLNNPQDARILSNLYLKTSDRGVSAGSYLELERIGARLVLSDIQQIETAQKDNIKNAAELTFSAPQFPDGYAYLGSLYLKDRNCVAAQSEVKKARELDPNREEFKELEEAVQACE